MRCIRTWEVGGDANLAVAILLDAILPDAILPDAILPDVLLITDEVQPLVKTKRRSSGVKTRVERGKTKGEENRSF